MTYKLSDRQLSELICIIPVQRIPELFPHYAPSLRTIYRRLAKHGIKDFSRIRKEFKTQLLLSAPPEISDSDAIALINARLHKHLEDLMTTIKNEAENYNARFEK